MAFRSGTSLPLPTADFVAEQLGRHRGRRAISIEQRLFDVLEHLDGIGANPSEREVAVMAALNAKRYGGRSTLDQDVIYQLQRDGRFVVYVSVAYLSPSNPTVLELIPANWIKQRFEGWQAILVACVFAGIDILSVNTVVEGDQGLDGGTVFSACIDENQQEAATIGAVFAIPEVEWPPYEFDRVPMITVPIEGDPRLVRRDLG